MSERSNELNRPLQLPPDAFDPLPEEERNAEFIAVESRTFFQDAWRNFRRNRVALVSLCFIVLMCLLAIFVPILSPYTYDGMDTSALNQLPSLQH